LVEQERRMLLSLNNRPVVVLNEDQLGVFSVKNFLKYLH